MRECSPPASCHMSHVMFHMSHVTCHMSHIPCHMSCGTCHFFLYFFRQSGPAYWWRVCCQWGLPHLVFDPLGQFCPRVVMSVRLSAPSDQFPELSLVHVRSALTIELKRRGRRVTTNELKLRSSCTGAGAAVSSYDSSQHWN